MGDGRIAAFRLWSDRRLSERRGVVAVAVAWVFMYCATVLRGKADKVNGRRAAMRVKAYKWSGRREKCSSRSLVGRITEAGTR